MFPDGNALRFSYCANEIRKPKTRNASRFRRLTLVEFNSFTTRDLNNNIHYHRLLKLTCLSSSYNIYSISAILCCYCVYTCLGMMACSSILRQYSHSTLLPTKLQKLGRLSLYHNLPEAAIICTKCGFVILLIPASGSDYKITRPVRLPSLTGMV
jgi:hypothetical protein